MVAVFLLDDVLKYSKLKQVFDGEVDFEVNDEVWVIGKGDIDFVGMQTGI